MNRVLVPCLLAAAVAAPNGPAVAAEEQNALLSCGSSWVDDPWPVQGHRNKLVAQVDGGPVVPTVVDADPVTLGLAKDVTLKCTVHIGGDGTHLATGSNTNRSAEFTSPGPVGVLPPTLLNLPDSPTDWYYLCTEVAWTTYLGPRRYYLDDMTGVLSPDPAVPCAVASSPAGSPARGA